MSVGFIAIFLWIAIQTAKAGKHHKNCSEFAEKLVITPYYIFHVQGNITEVGFNISFASVGERTVCLDDYINSPECKIDIRKSYVTFEKVFYGQKARPRLNFPSGYTVQYYDGRTRPKLECKYFPPVKAERTVLRDIPKPDISVNTFDSGINISWSLENIIEFTDAGADLRLNIRLNEDPLEIYQTKLSCWIDEIQLNESITIEAFYMDYNRGERGPNFNFSLANWHFQLPSKVSRQFGSEKVAWILLGTGCPAFLSIILWYLCRKRGPSKIARVTNAHSVVNWHSEYNPMYFIEPAARNDTFNRVIKAKELRYERKLGEGNYGQVDLHRWISRQHPRGLLVAVKTFKDIDAIKDGKQYENELEIFRKVGFHRNIVEFMGSNADLPWFIVTEYMENGDLATHLRFLRKGFTQGKDRLGLHHEEGLTSKDLEYFGKEIGSGMAHLEKCKVVHRDLAARNVLLGRNKSVKIADFGLSRQGTYFNTMQCQLPVRWMAPETFMEQSLLMCTSKSDVWSFGVVLWEIGTLGALPYEDMDYFQMMDFIRRNQRLQQPELVRNSLYKLMLDCWCYNFEARPSFRDILCQLESMSAYLEFTDLQPTYQFPPTYYGPMSSGFTK